MACSNKMTPRERWLAAVGMRPVDRLPFWPKLSDAYPIAQSPPFRSMKIDEIHDWLDSDKHVWVSPCLICRRKQIKTDTAKSGDTCKTVWSTSAGSLTLVEHWDTASQSWHPVSHPVSNVEQIKIMTAVYDDAVPELGPAALDRVKSQVSALGNNAVTAASVGTSPLMEWVEHIAGVENGTYLLFDHKKEVDALFHAMHKYLVKATAIVAGHCPADLIYFTENTSTTLISPAQYDEYSFHHVSEYGRILKSMNRIFVLHMCGKLKALLPQLNKVPALAFEAFTSPTLGDTTLLDGRTHCPPKCLVGGTNAVLWTKDADSIIAGIEEALGTLPHHRGIVVTSAGVMPPLCKPETIKTVCDRVKSFPAKM